MLLRKLVRLGLTFRCVEMVISFAAATGSPARAAFEFEHPFSPQTGLTAPVEQPWRQEICLNGLWQFQPVSRPADYRVENGAPLLPEPKSDGWSATPIRIPSPWNVNAFGFGTVKPRTFPSYPKEWDSAQMGWLRRSFKVPAEWAGKRLILHFDAVCGYTQVFVNGQQVAEHFDNSLPFEADITDFVDLAGENTLLVGVRKASLFDVPGVFGRHTYAAGSNWTLEMVGIWQDVFLRALPPVRVDRIAVRPIVAQGVLELEVTVRNNTALTQSFKLGGDVRPWINQAGNDLLSAPVPKSTLGDPVARIAAVEGTVGPRMTTTLTLRQPIKDELKNWSPESPNLYGLVLDLAQAGKTEDRFYQRFGWRQWGIVGRDVTLNGKPYQLRADSGHLLGVSFMTRRYAWSWYRAIKDVNGNAIRLHAIVRPRFYLELADEMGIAILDETDIWASSMDINYYAPETWARFGDHIDHLVLRDRNHASVFGWSIANEIFSALWWKGMPRKYWPPVIDNMVALADRVRALDPTRPWISSDGDGDFHGRLPTYIYHYGKPQDWNRQAPKDKPFGIGEGGSMVWGSPAVFSVYNDERSYESREGMLEGIAIETYYYLTEQRKMAAFCSVFTIEGICFEPLTLGAGDPRGRPAPDDGIVFGPFVEGQPGMQPERLPARGTNFNPGYDPRVPLYRTTAAFEAVKAAYAPDGPLPSKWDHQVKSPPRPRPAPPTIEQIGFIGVREGALGRALETSGVAFAPEARAPLLVVDGASLTVDRLTDATKRVQETLQQHGTVFVWAASENLEQLNALLPAKLSLTAESATALAADRQAPETAPLSLADLYFADQSDAVILRQGLAGPLVEQGRVLITANSFSRRWFVGADETKAPALVAMETGGGRLLVTSLSPDVRSSRRLKLMRGLFENLGVALGKASDKFDTGFDGAGFVNQALVIGAFQGERYPEILDTDLLGNENAVDPKPGDQAGGRTWTFCASPGSGLFDFFQTGAVAGLENTRARMRLDGVLKPEALDANQYLEVSERVFGSIPGTNSVVYLSFWVRAPRATEAATTDRASELAMLLRSDDGAKVWVNSKPVFADRKISGPGLTEPKSVPVALQAGWNHVLVKIGQLDGLWNFSVRFDSSDARLVEKLRVAATKPN